MKECHTYLRALQMDLDRAVEVWTLMYRHILEVHRHEGEWSFFHFNQLLTEEGLGRLSAITEADVDHSFPDPSLRRSQPGPLPPGTDELYRKLCNMAGYSEPAAKATSAHMSD